MAFPADAARATTNGSTAATNKVCNLPTGIAAGNRLTVLLRSAGADTHSLPTGWSWLVQNNAADASDDVTSIIWKIADGSEGATVTINGTASLKFASIAWRITGGGTPQISAAATGTSTTPNPPSFSPTGGAQDYLWLWVGAWEGEQTSPPSGSPTNYVNPFGANSGTAGTVATNCRAAGASRQLNAATEDPPSWTISVSDDWTAWTIAVPPASPTRGLISWAEAEIPFVATRGLVSWAETEVPLANTRGLVSWAEAEVPFANTRGLVSWAEVEVPLAPTRGRISWAEAEVPDLSPTRGLISWAEVEVPLVPTRGLVSWAEAEVPDVGAGGPGRTGGRFSPIRQRSRLR